MNSYPKRLIEVDLPIKRISAHARREKSIRHGHISTLHIWWARRPLAACRAVVCAALWPDPADEKCPPAFRHAAARILVQFAEEVRSDAALAELCQAGWSRWNRTNGTSLRAHDPACWADLRYAMLDFIADFTSPDASTNPVCLETARALTQAAHEALGGSLGSRPFVLDPFAGGGAIPLEAARIGADAFASDLNPVAVLLNKVMLEYIPRYGQRLADEVHRLGSWVRQEVERQLLEIYPTDQDGSVPIAYIWARTIQCEGPSCGIEVPLLRSLWLSKKSSRPMAMRLAPNASNRRVDIDIVEVTDARAVDNGTVRRGSVTCPVCGYTTPAASVRRQLSKRNGGAADARLCAVAVLRSGHQGRFYRRPSQHDFDALHRADERLAELQQARQNTHSLVPTETLPLMSGVFNAPIYGHNTWGSLFTSRQALSMVMLAQKVREAGNGLRVTDDQDFATAVETLLALAVDKQADLGNSLCAWEPIAECPRHLFGRQAIGMVWDFAEGVIVGSSSGSWSVQVDRLEYLLRELGSHWLAGEARQASATSCPLPDDSAQAVITDPPYYNAVPYADLSDFFYVWLKRMIAENHPSLFQGELVPKDDEICEMAGWDPVRYKYKNGLWFEQRMSLAMAEARRVLAPDGIGVIVFAHKSTAGWEALLQATVDAGWRITGSWPIDTEMGSRLRARDSAVLASSVHLVCRPRELPSGALQEEIGDWRDVLVELPERVHEWMSMVAAEGVAGADAIFACLGPALEIFSRYSRVEKASGEQIKLGEYLEHVWAAVSREALNMIFSGADATGFEPDARITAMWLWTLAAGAVNGSAGGSEAGEEDTEPDDDGSAKTPAPTGFSLEFDAARKIAQGLGAHLDRLTQVVEVKGDTARLLSVAERTRYLFGKGEAQPATSRPRRKAQLDMFAELAQAEDETTIGVSGAPPPGTTTLDRVHQAMILFGSGRAEGLRRFLVEQGVGNDQAFWRLAQALSALYPPGTDEKRWVDGVLARKRGLGL